MQPIDGRDKVDANHPRAWCRQWMHPIHLSSATITWPVLISVLVSGCNVAGRSADAADCLAYIFAVNKI